MASFYKILLQPLLMPYTSFQVAALEQTQDVPDVNQTAKLVYEEGKERDLSGGALGAIREQDGLC